MLEDIELILALGLCCGMVSVLVLCLYISSPDVLKLYRQPKALWLICPILLYWIARVWFLARRQQMVHDPVIFALRDKISYLAGVLTAAILVAASLGLPSWLVPSRPLAAPVPGVGSIGTTSNRFPIPPSSGSVTERWPGLPANG